MSINKLMFRHTTFSIFFIAELAVQLRMVTDSVNIGDDDLVPTACQYGVVQILKCTAAQPGTPVTGVVLCLETSF